MFRKIILIITLLIEFASGQNGILEGKITDISNGKPLQGVIVFINYGYMDYTDNDGNFLIKDLIYGNYTVKISHLGYKSAAGFVKIDRPETRRDFQLESSPVELDEIIVSTDRMNNYLRNSAYSELLVSEKEISEKPYQSLPEALKTEPGISLLRDGIWGTEINIRGLSRENVVTLIDGTRIVTSTDIAARLSMIDMNDIQRVEIIKGASSSIYGSGATGGIVNVVTKTPHFSSGHYINGNISGGFNSVNNSSSASGILYSGNSLWSAKIAGSYRNADNTKTPAGELKNSQFKDYSFSGNFNIRPFENHKLKLNYQLFKAENVGIPGASVFPGNASVRYPAEKREMVSGAYEIQNISKLLYKLSAKYSYSYIFRDVENLPFTVQNIPASGTNPARRVSVLKITPHAEHRSNNIDISGNFLLSERNNFVLGIDYWDRSYRGSREKFQLIEILNSSGNVAASNEKIIGESPLPNSESRNIGIYLQDEILLLREELSLSLGARADKIFITGDKTFNPVYEILNGVRNDSPAGQQVIWDDVNTNTESYSSNLGLKYSFTPALDITLSIGFSFRSPSLEERFQYIDQGTFVRLGNPSLKSEKGNSADIGLRYYTPGFKLISSFFFNYFTDLVVEEPGMFEGKNAFIKTNIGKARLYGFDLSTDYNFYNDFFFSLAASYTRGDDITLDEDLPSIPPLNMNIGFRANLFDKVQVGISSMIFAEQNKTAKGELSTPGYAVFDLSLNPMPVDLKFASVQLYSGVENIFDKSYRNHLSTTRGFMKLEPGRNFYVRLVTQW